MFVLQDLQTIPQNGQSREATLRKTPDKWCNERHNAVKEQAFPQYQKYAFFNIFRKYNTSIPNSVAVERVFSIGFDVLRPQRSSLRSKTEVSEVKLSLRSKALSS